nr:hypothetical protein C5F59_37015 [Streptomyces sp. QL37]
MHRPFRGAVHLVMAPRSPPPRRLRPAGTGRLKPAPPGGQGPGGAPAPTPSRHSVNLRGWTLTDESRRSYKFDLRLPGRSSVRVHTGVGRDNGPPKGSVQRSTVDRSTTAGIRAGCSRV